MIKQYEGNGVYTLHLTSGRELCLTEDEINEIADNSEQIEELKRELNDSISVGNLYASVIDDIKNRLEELEEDERI